MPITAFKSNVLEDRLITSILGKSSHVVFSIAVSEPSFCSIYFVDTLHDSQHALHNAVQLQWMLDGGGGGLTYWEFSICFGIFVKSMNQCLNWPAQSVLQNI